MVMFLTSVCLAAILLRMLWKDFGKIFGAQGMIREFLKDSLFTIAITIDAEE